MENELSKILIFGGTGYLGKYMVKASVSMGHKTYVYARPITTQSSPAKIGIHEEFQAMGVTIVQVLPFTLHVHVQKNHVISLNIVQINVAGRVR